MLDWSSIIGGASEVDTANLDKKSRDLAPKFIFIFFRLRTLIMLFAFQIT